LILDWDSTVIFFKITNHESRITNHE